MSLQAKYQYDTSKKCFIGHVTIPLSEKQQNDRKERFGKYDNDSEIATHALNAILYGLSTFWKQFIAFHFTGNSFCAKAVAKWIVEILSFCFKINLNPLLLSMDSGKSNIAVQNELSILVSGTAKKYHVDFIFEVDGHQIAGVADPTHIQKAIRNAIYNNKEIEFDPKDVKEYNLPGSKVKWEHFQKVVDFDEQYQLGIAKHLKREFVYQLGTFMKMKVPPAKKVLSRATSVSIKMLHKRYPEQYPEEYLVTAFFCDIADE